MILQKETHLHGTVNRSRADVAGIQQRLPIRLIQQTYRNVLRSLTSGNENQSTAGIRDDIAE